METKKSYIIIATIVLMIILLVSLTNLITDYWWFMAAGFSQIFLITLKTKVYLFIAAALIVFFFILLNLLIASRNNNQPKNKPLWRLKLFVLFVISIFVGIQTSDKWFILLQYLNQVQFNITDPIFMQDVAFYVFSLPFLLEIWRFIFTLLVLTIIFVVIEYFQSFIQKIFTQKENVTVVGPDGTKQSYGPSFDLKQLFLNVKKFAIIHITVLASLVFLLIAFRNYLTQYSIMFSEKGIVIGAGYTDVMVFLPIVKILIVLAIIITILFYLWLFYIQKRPNLRKHHIVASVIFLYLILALIGPTIIPATFQSLKVSPNELNLEEPYIANNIEYTRMAYGLNDIVVTEFPLLDKITAENIQDANQTIDNIRILDYRPLIQTYKQTQEIRLYYDLSGIDIDRYVIDDKYTQVMISARELNQQQIADNAKTWVNLHMVYTHGFGLVMSPVNTVTEDGLPDYLIKDVPPKNIDNHPALEIAQPRIYYGQKTSNYVLTNTQTQEFDYPKGTTNEYTHYDGTGGIVLDTFFKKFMMAIRFRDIKILLSSDVTDQSKIMFDRNIQTRIQKITQFLKLDNDPYLVLLDGNLYWIQDAYTTTDKFPYSEKYQNINYIRNSVKIVMDAYDGKTTYYIMDQNDPLIKTYSSIFPEAFTSASEMPAELKAHIRYPEDLFKIQSQLYSIYHMQDPSVFYNKEDAWQIPREIYGTGQAISVEPYYVILKLPDENKEEFIMMTPFSPLRKDNMVSWFAARNDGDNYGELIVYKFPKDKLVYGPLQIEAKFDQDSEISEQLTLWSQQGSSVTRGNLLIIPIENSLLYIEPLYIRAEQGQLPQLKRILVSDGEKVVMEETLDEALMELLGVARKDDEGSDISDEDGIETDLISQAKIYYERILESMQDQDWEGFGDNFNRLGNILNRLNISE